MLLSACLKKYWDRFERENGGYLLVATLCLLEVSSGGLQESELLHILADESDLVPPSPFEEKGKAKHFRQKISSLLYIALV